MKKTRFIALMLVLGVLFAACGDDKPTSATGDLTQDTVDSGDIGDVGDGIDLTDDDCLFGLEALQNNPMFEAMSGTADPEDLEQALALMNEMAANAPEEIQADFQIIVDAYTQIVSIFANSDFDPADPTSVDPEMIAALQQLDTTIDQEALSAASANIQAYFAENCGAPAQ